MKHLVIAASLISFVSVAHAKSLTRDHVHLLSHGKWIMTDEDAPKSIKLHEQEQMSYDTTSTADATDLAKPRAFTLLAEAGSCRVETTKRVFVGTHPDGPAKLAFEIDPSACKLDRIILAVDDTTDATIELPSGNQQQSTTRVAAWVKGMSGKSVALDTDKHPRVFVEPIDGGLALITAAYTDGHNEVIVRKDDIVLARFTYARAIAIVHDHGDRLVLQTSQGLRVLTI